VVDGKRAYITPKALETAEKAWDEIVKAIMRPKETRVRNALMAIVLNALGARVEQLRAYPQLD